MSGQRAWPCLPTVRHRRDRVEGGRSHTRSVSATGRAVLSLLCESRAHAEQVARIHRIHASGEWEGAEVGALLIDALNLAAVHESAIGPKRTLGFAPHMSAFGCKADT